MGPQVGRPAGTDEGQPKIAVPASGNKAGLSRAELDRLPEEHIERVLDLALDLASDRPHARVVARVPASWRPSVPFSGTACHSVTA